MIFPPNEVQVVLTMHASRVQEFAEYLRRTCTPGGPSTGSLLARVLDQLDQQGHGARLAVIDTDSRADVERLRDLFDAAWAEHNRYALPSETAAMRGNALQAALREYVNPTSAPPAPPEPTGLGAVVEASCVHDPTRHRWVRGHTGVWLAPAGQPDDYASLRNVKVLSEGTPA